MATPPRVTGAQVEEGLHWFMLGLFKKTFLADHLAHFVDPVFADPWKYTGGTCSWAAVAYAAQIYCDFSGYSDMAIGCAKWFGFELPPNFNFPYVAGSITEFWRRWHVSLSTWIRDYLYIPLGGNRRGVVRTYVNLVLTMTLCGLWHGASWNFVAWGFYHGVLLAAHRVWDRALRGRPWADRVRAHPLYHLAATAGTCWLAVLGFVAFRARSWAVTWQIGKAVLGVGPATGQLWVPAWLPLLVGLVAAGHVLGGLRGRSGGLLGLPPLVRAAAYVAAVLLLTVFGPGTTRAFIYFQF
jgi:alginate O-acetyltransferase complex protein AlgI